MADKFKMGLAGLFKAGGSALAIIGKEKTQERGVAYDLFIRLSQNPRYSMKEGFEFKQGMTRVQVMQGFEEEEFGSTGVTTQLLTQRQIDLQSKRPGFEWMRGAKEGDVTYGMISSGLRERGQTLTRDTALDRMAMQAYTNEIKMKMQTEKGKVAILSDLLKMHVADINERLDDPILGPLLETLFKRADFKVEKRYEGLRRIIADRFGPTKILAPKPFEVTPTTPAPDITIPRVPSLMQRQGEITPPAGRGQIPPPTGTQDTRPPDNELIEEIKQYGGVREAKQALMQKYGMSGIEVEQFIKKYEAQITGQAQQITTPGLTEAGVGGIERELGRPALAGVGARPSAPRPSFGGTSPSTFMPNASPYNRLKTLSYLRNIPRQR